MSKTATTGINGMLRGKLFCSVYKSARRADTYLYVERARGLDKLPAALLAQFGKPLHVTDMILDPERKLARVDPRRVMEKIREQGFYLQMPPPPDADLYLADGHPEKPRRA